MYTGDWHGLYGARWGADLVPDAYAHPAKFARGLIRRIYAHLLDRGYLKPGDRVVDPFGGVALGGLDAMLNGLHWIGNELEGKFVDLGQQNIEHWIKRYRWMWPDTWGSAVLLQGDSRELGRVIAEAGGLVSSPPYAESMDHAPGNKSWIEEPTETQARHGNRGYSGQVLKTTGYGTQAGNLGNMRATDEGLAAVVSSPPFGAGETRDRAPVQDGEIADCITRAYTQDRQGTTPGNLATMETTDAGLDAVLSSPPYSHRTVHGQSGIDRSKLAEPERAGRRSQDVVMDNYGDTEGQLAAMREGDHDAVISSPPYEGSNQRYTETDACRERMAEQGLGDRRGCGLNRSQHSMTADYGDSPGQLAGDSGEDFWTAARAIVDQCYLVLKPGAVAVWVVKRFVRDKQIVNFPDQWRQMCEAAGFETVEWIRAWVVEEKGQQLDLWGNGHELKTERKSFFRRLYESKYPENRIDWEDVIIQRRLP